MELREATRADAAAIAALIERHSRALHGERDLTPSQVLEWFDLPAVSMRVVEQEGAYVGYADLSEEAGRWSIDLRTLEGKAAELLLRDAIQSAGSGALLRGYADSRDTVAVAAYAGAGFAVVRNSFQMRVQFDEAPPSTVFPEGIEVRPMHEGEEALIHAAHMDAFADHWDFHEQSYDQWRRWHRDRELFDASLWFLALDPSRPKGPEIAGFALCGPHYSGEPDFGWVDLLGVRPPWRRRGLGEALLRHGFRELYGRGFSRIGLGVDAENTSGAVGLYERVGMTAIRRSDTWELRNGEART